MVLLDEKRAVHGRISMKRNILYSFGGDGAG